MIINYDLKHKNIVKMVKCGMGELKNLENGEIKNNLMYIAFEYFNG